MCAVQSWPSSYQFSLDFRTPGWKESWAQEQQGERNNQTSVFFPCHLHRKFPCLFFFFKKKKKRDERKKKPANDSGVSVHRVKQRLTQFWRLKLPVSTVACFYRSNLYIYIYENVCCTQIKTHCIFGVTFVEIQLEEICIWCLYSS